MAMEGRVFQPQAEEERVLAQHERDRAAAVTPELGVATDSRPRGVQTPHRPLPLPAVLARLESRPFVDRATPLRRLGALWEQVSLGKGGVVALAGEPGIGKSRLTARVAARAHAEGAVVLYGRADEESVSPYRHSSLAWRGVRAGLLGRFQDAERMARDSLRLAEHAQAPDAQAHFTAQLVALRREQGRLDELAPAIERLAGDAPADAVWRCVLPLAHLDAGARTQAQMAYERALGDGVASVPRTMLWLTAMASLAEAAARLDDPDGASQLYAELEPYADRLAQWSFTGSAGSVHRLLGRTAAVAGWDDRARMHFDAALRRHAELGAAPLLARTRCDYGELLLRGTRADHPMARRYLREAGRAARRLGMAGVAQRADRH